MEMGDSQLKFSRKRAVLDVWLRIIGATMDLKNAESKELCLAVADSRHLLTGFDCPDRTERDSFEVQNCRYSGIFVLVSVTEPGTWLAYPASPN